MAYLKTGRLTRLVAATGALAMGVTGAGVMALIGAAPADAATITRYVGATVGSDTSCASPGYTSVQAAVNAASPGDKVFLCGAVPFKGQVIIHKSVTLTGSTGATIAAPSTFGTSPALWPPQFTADNLFVPQAIVVAWGSGVHVTIRGLKVTGTLPGNGGCAEQEFGILVIAGASANITRDAVKGIRDANPSLYGCQFGVGIMIGREYWPTSNFSTSKVEDFVGTASISHTTVTGYQKAGIVIDGPGSHATVSNSTVTGAGPTSALGKIIAQNGIQLSRGAGGQVVGNKVSDNQYSGKGNASDGGVLIFGGCGDPLVTHVSVSENTLVNNDVGVYVQNAKADCATAPSSATSNVVTENQISDAAVTNVSGLSVSPLCGYQAGVSDLGNHDVITYNDIDGAGYLKHPTCSTSQPYQTLPIDTTGSLNVVRHGNV